MADNDVGMCRRGWILWILLGFAAVVCGGGTLWVGVEAADKIGSVVGAACGMLGLALSVYGLRARPSEPSAGSGDTSVTSSITDSRITGPVQQDRPTDGAATDGASNVVGNNNVVAGPGGVAVGSGGYVVVGPMAVFAEPLPPPAVELCVGRDSQVAEVVSAWTDGQSVLVAGGPGIGKSTVLGRAITEQAVITLYGARRFVVSCDGAESVGAVVDKIAQVLGVVLGDHLRNRVLAFLRETPCVLVLDNFEAPTNFDPGGASQLVAELRTNVASSIAVGIGYRGGGTPGGMTGLVEIVLGPLRPYAAVEVFVKVAGRRHRGDLTVGRLVAELDGVPLAITLLATLARTEVDLDTLASAWRAKHTDLLEYGARPDRTSSLPVSIELSWDRLSLDARDALSLAALLPNGWPRGRSALYLPKALAAGVIELGGRALLHDDVPRQRCLAPIRQHILANHPPEPAALAKLAARVRALAEPGNRIGARDGANVIDLVAPEFANIVNVIRASLSHYPDIALVVPNLLRFQRFTGLGDDQLAQEMLVSGLAPQNRAAIASALGSFYIARGENYRARDLLAQMLPLYQQVKDVLGEAKCLRKLGEVEFRESSNDRARELFSQALPLFQHVRNVLGEANCLRHLGEVELRISNNSRACELFNLALPLYQRVGHFRGEANCLFILGQVELRNLNDDRARELLSQALSLYQRVGDRHSQAVTHAWLARMTVGRQRIEHSNQMDMLASELDLPGFAKSLHEIANIWVDSRHRTP